MNTYPYQINPHEPTKKQVWLASFTALLTHMSPEEAVEAADRALELSEKRWENPKWVRTWQFIHNYPVGHRVVVRFNDPPEEPAPNDLGQHNEQS
ncbi:hypothetical protein [Dyella sp. ASV21]|uniref:hypothetical protein n=1 Tax=Dyella sp. ASV21 TaxID=2795114 RepID=UPI0018EAA7A4|nr:hypothetical protein [Dyella sp. ASV21]